MTDQEIHLHRLIDDLTKENCNQKDRILSLETAIKEWAKLAGETPQKKTSRWVLAEVPIDAKVVSFGDFFPGFCIDDIFAHLIIPPGKYCLIIEGVKKTGNL